jgi:hypothetical protein
MVERSDEVVDEAESAGRGMSRRGVLHIARGAEGGARDFLTASAYVRSGVKYISLTVQADAGGPNEMRPAA